MKIALLVVVSGSGLLYSAACYQARKYYPGRSGPAALARLIKRIAWDATNAE